jgi:hypothetical protein
MFRSSDGQHMRALGEQYLGRSPVFNPQCSVVPSLLPDLAMAKERRKNAVYLQHVFALVHCVGHNARSIVDDGSHGCPLSRVVRLDSDEGLNRHPQALPVPPTVEGIAADFLTFERKQRFDICLCLQVLEHIPEAKAFAQKLLASSPRC